MKHYLNICDIHGWEVQPVDLVTFGSPCQSLSVAGHREGLRHAALGDEETTRSGLFMEAIRIIKEMREATHGEYPKWAMWENVPGAYTSSGGEDFRIVLEELAKIKEQNVSIPRPENGKWKQAGCVEGNGWSIAWKTVDAKHFGVAQRRRRILLILCLTGECAAEVLFKPQSLPWHHQENENTQENPAANALECIGTDHTAVGLDGYNFAVTGDVVSTLGVNCGMSTGRNGIIEKTIAVTDTASTLRAGAGAPKHYQDIVGRIVLAPVLVLNDQGGASVNVEKTGISPTLRSESHQHEPVVCYVKDQPAIALQGSMIGRKEENGPLGDGINEDVCFTLNTIDRHAVAYGISAYNSNGMLSDNPHSGCYEADTSRTLDLNGGNPACNQGGIVIAEELFEMDTEHYYIARRLTPVECARLQGFPDNWGSVQKKKDFTDEEFEWWNNVYRTHQIVICGKNPEKVKKKSKKQLLTWYNKLWSDGAEYKMWGNGVALPCVRLPIHNMAGMGVKTMASLFDGSGGFPLASVLEGIVPVWCSEIEPYPIAVTCNWFDKW